MISAVTKNFPTSFILLLCIKGKSQWCAQVESSHICFFKEFGVTKHFISSNKIMNRSDWKTFYHPKKGKFLYKHKGTGVVTDSIFKLGKVLKKPLANLVKKTGQKVAEKVAEKASTVAVKKAGDKIANLVSRKRTKGARKTPAGHAPQAVSRKPVPTQQDLIALNNLISQL